MPSHATVAPRLTHAGLIALALLAAAVVGAATLRSPLIGIALAGVLSVGGAALRYPDVATYAVLFLLYSNLPAISVAFHGVPKVVAAGFPLLLVVPLARDLFLRRQALILTPAFWLLMLLLAVQAVGAAFSIKPDKSLEAVITFLVEGVILYLLITNVLRTKKVLRGATWALVGAGVLMSAVPLFQQATRTFDNDYGGLAQVDGGGFGTDEIAEEGGEVRQARLGGPIGEKNRYAQVMLVLVPLGLFCIFTARTGWQRILALGATVSIGLGFTLAFSRGGAIGAMCMLMAMMAMRLIDFRKAVFVAAGMVLLLAAVPQYWKRLATIGESLSALNQDSGGEADGAVKRRLTTTFAAVRVFIDHPVVGVGPGLFKEYSMGYGNQDALRRIESGRRAHSLLPEIAAENGALGLAFFLAAIAVTLVGLAAGRRALLERDPELAQLCTFYLLALICYLTTGMFLHLSYMRYFYVVLALAGAVAHVAFEARRELERRPIAAGALRGAAGGAA
jgi:putative inorganic carbon (HCO3(-)) transporter